jgi:membrane protease YdiL (CAAX protease family)
VSHRRIRAESPAGRVLAIGVAIVVTALAWILPDIAPVTHAVRLLAEPVMRISMRTAHALVLLVLGLALCLPRRRRSGLRIGRIRQHWTGVLIVCALPVLLTALVYPQLPERPFANAGIAMWLISPLAQDLVFMGYLFGRFERSFPPRGNGTKPGIALLLGALCFAAWHLQNLFADVSTSYVLFQMAYTAAGFMLTGLSRQWTGSLLYAAASHTLVNLVAALAS